MIFSINNFAHIKFFLDSSHMSLVGAVVWIELGSNFKWFAFVVFETFFVFDNVVFSTTEELLQFLLLFLIFWFVLALFLLVISLCNRSIFKLLLIWLILLLLLEIRSLEVTKSLVFDLSNWCQILHQVELIVHEFSELAWALLI